MSETSSPAAAFGWHDLTVTDADAVATFYERVLGWTRTEHPLSDADGDYADFVMADAAGNVVGGICHARGPNKAIPPVWMVYVTVADADAAVKETLESGGTLIDGPKPMGGGKVAFVRDPAGAAFGLYEASKDA